jgi:hypothetical protein
MNSGIKGSNEKLISEFILMIGIIEVAWLALKKMNRKM